MPRRLTPRVFSVKERSSSQTKTAPPSAPQLDLSGGISGILGKWRSSRRPAGLLWVITDGTQGANLGSLRLSSRLLPQKKAQAKSADNKDTKTQACCEQREIPWGLAVSPVAAAATGRWGRGFLESYWKGQQHRPHEVQTKSRRDDPGTSPRLTLPWTPPSASAPPPRGKGPRRDWK